MVTLARDPAVSGGPLSSLPSIVPLTYNIKVELLKTPAMCVHPLIGVEPETVCQDIPSYIENFAIFSGVSILFSDKIKDLSFETIAYSGEPLV